MRILVALDQQPYSSHVIHEVANLAMNTWPDVTLLGVLPKKPPINNGARSIKDVGMVTVLQGFRAQFLSYFPDDEASPYAKKELGYEFVEKSKNLWEELCVCRSIRKDLSVKIRFGSPVKQILAEAEEQQCDLIILGCSKGKHCEWEQDKNAPEKIAKNAHCSVLIVKEEKKANKIVCCLDHDSVSQESLEMINQMVTLHNSELVIVGLTESERLKQEIDSKMKQILQYYNTQKIKAWVSVVNVSLFEDFVLEAAEKSLVALWMGSRSKLKSLFSPDMVGKLVNTAQSSVLVLR